MKLGVIRMSKGEDKISSLLKSANISYEKEYTFSDLKYKGIPLRFDFAIKVNGKLILLEVDGQQHYTWIKKFGTYSDFKHMQENDRRKNSYCIRNNIPLIRIPYWDLDKITIYSIFNNSNYLVKSKFHNDLLRPPY